MLLFKFTTKLGREFACLEQKLGNLDEYAIYNVRNYRNILSTRFAFYGVLNAFRCDRMKDELL